MKSVHCLRPLVRIAAAVAVVLLGGLFPVRAAQPAPVLDEELGRYRATPVTGLPARLNERLAAGTVRLQFDATNGYLDALLREWRIPAASQLLVASKTSPHKLLISPRNPRAVYFNDQAAIAYVPGSDTLEIMAFDPRLGVSFHTLAQKRSDRPELRRDDRCLECHVSGRTMNVPGWLARSFDTLNDGDVDPLSGRMITHRTPFAERWGGYYVTGAPRGLPHRGNQFGPDSPLATAGDRPEVNDLRGRLDVSRYPATGSEVAALLVMDHQAHLFNLLTRYREDAVAAQQTDTTLRGAHPAGEAVLKYLLCLDETPLPVPLPRDTAFVAWFEGQGPVDQRGRSLRQLDLQKRLFQHPCSPVLYSPAFDTLPPVARKHLLRRLWDILNGDDTSPEYSAIPPGTRQVLREIIAGTVRDLPAFWRL